MRPDSGARAIASTTAQNTSGVVRAVSFSTGAPVLEFNNGVSVPVSDLLEVDSQPTTNQ